MARRRSFSPQVDAAIQGASQRSGISVDVLRAIARVESNGNPETQTGSYKGLFQLGDSNFRRFGSGNIWDPADNANAAAAQMQHQIRGFEQRYGRAPSPAELYLSHQQGVGGAHMHRTYPDRPAWQNMLATGEGRQRGESWARQAIWGNVPRDLRAQYGSVDNITSRQFTQMWGETLARRGGIPLEVATAPITGGAPVQVAQAQPQGPPQVAEQARASTMPDVTDPASGVPPDAIGPLGPVTAETQQQPSGPQGVAAFAQPGIAPPDAVAEASQLLTRRVPVTNFSDPQITGGEASASAMGVQPAPSVLAPPPPPEIPPPQMASFEDPIGKMGGGGGGLLGLGGGRGGGGGFKPPAPIPRLEDPAIGFARWDATAEDRLITIPRAPPRTPPGFPVADLMGRGRRRGSSA